MKTTLFNDGMKSRERREICIVVPKNGTIHKFIGESIPGICFSTILEKNKNGKWSSTTYEIMVHDDTDVFSWYQTFEEGLFFPQKSLEDGYQWLKDKVPNCTLESFKKFISANMPKTSERWNEYEKACSFFSVGNVLK
jgi:hypothetical protein